MLNVWASWCVPCKEEAPYLEQVWRAEPRPGARRASGSTRRTSAATPQDSASRFGLTFPIVFDGPGDTLDGYGVTGFPETFVLDREGRVVEAFVGAVNGDEDRARLRAAIEEALTT